MERNKGRLRRPLLTARLVGGEGDPGEHEEEDEANLWVPLVRKDMAGGGGSAASGGCRSSGHGGGVAPVVDGRREVVGKMREGEADLLEGLD